MKTIATHYIDGTFVESHGREVMDIVRPTDGTVIARATLGDQEDTRRDVWPDDERRAHQHATPPARSHFGARR